MTFNQYAQYYDIFYQKKKYKKECDFIERLFSAYCLKRPRTILDLGCGTANHMIPLILRGYQLVGVDNSSQMLGIARDKITRLNLKGKLLKRKLQAFDLKAKFDAIICMFSVINYVVHKKEIVDTLANVVRHMNRKSVFMFDFWNADAVEKCYAPTKTRVFNFEDKTIERQSVSKIYPKRRICEVNYTCILRQNRQLLGKFKEKHRVRYFSIEEMKSLLHTVGLEVLGLYPFLNFRGKIRKNTWDVTVVSKKV